MQTHSVNGPSDPEATSSNHRGCTILIAPHETRENRWGYTVLFEGKTVASPVKSFESKADLIAHATKLIDAALNYFTVTLEIVDKTDETIRAVAEGNVYALQLAFDQTVKEINSADDLWTRHPYAHLYRMAAMSIEALEQSGIDLVFRHELSEAGFSVAVAKLQVALGRELSEREVILLIGNITCWWLRMTEDVRSGKIDKDDDVHMELMPLVFCSSDGALMIPRYRIAEYVGWESLLHAQPRFLHADEVVRHGKWELQHYELAIQMDLLFQAEDEERSEFYRRQKSEEVGEVAKAA